MPTCRRACLSTVSRGDAMIETMWPYLAIMLLAAGLFPSLERRYRWRFFSVLPPIVLTYLFVTALAVAGVWSPTGEVQTRAAHADHATSCRLCLFLLMVTCDLRAILKVGPRVLAVFACAMGSILLAIIIVYVLFRGVLPQDGWKMLAALSATWTGGSANLRCREADDRPVRQSVAAGAARRCAVLLAVGAVAVVERLVRAALQSLDAR